MSRARGANARAQFNFEDVYGQPRAAANANWYLVPFVSHTMGEERKLIASDLLGQGREMLDPTQDVANNVGDVTVAMDVRNIGLWLKLYMGAPATVASAAAAGTWTPTGQPADNSTLTLNGTEVTFVAAGPVGAEVLIGADIAATLANLETYLSGSADAQISKCTYAVANGALTATNKTLGPAGNAFTLAASADANGAWSGAALTGGLNTHTFTSGVEDLPSASLEIGNPEVPSFGMNYGVMGDKLKVSLQRSGLLNGQLSLIAQGETLAAATAASANPQTLEVERFAQATGVVKKDGAALGEVVSAEFTIDNALETDEIIRPDGRIGGADPGMFAFSFSIVTRFATTDLLDQAASGEPCAISFGWSAAGGMSLTVAAPRVFLPTPKRPIPGPKGIQITQEGQSARDPATGHAVTITLVNDVAAY